MQKNTYQVIVENDGSEYVIQAVDEMDKNHGIEDTELSNRGRMYATNGHFHLKYFLIVIKSHTM